MRCLHLKFSTLLNCRYIFSRTLGSLHSLSAEEIKACSRYQRSFYSISHLLFCHLKRGPRGQKAGTCGRVHACSPFYLCTLLEVYACARTHAAQPPDLRPVISMLLHRLRPPCTHLRTHACTRYENNPPPPRCISTRPRMADDDITRVSLVHLQGRWC